MQMNANRRQRGIARWQEGSLCKQRDAKDFVYNTLPDNLQIYWFQNVFFHYKARLYKVISLYKYWIDRSNSSDSMFFSVYLFLSLGVVPFFYSNGGFLVTGNEQYVHQGESMLEIGSRDIQSEKIQLKLWL